MKNRKAYPTKYYIRVITFIIFSTFTFFYRIKKKLPAEVKKLKSPYLLLSNHVGTFDPFIAGNFLPRFTRFVASDSIFRSKIMRFFLIRLGTIPKKKNVRDTKVIRDIVSVIQQGENVGIFPEAVRNWSGTSFQMDKSIVKLIKLLKVPVVVSVLKGMNLFNPRWSKKLRFTKVEVEYKLLLRHEDVKFLSEEEIFAHLSNVLKHDEVDYQREKMNRIYSKNKAEHISHALFICPQCNAIDSFIAKKNNFVCTACNYDIYINVYGFYERKSVGKLYFDNIRDWYNWQEKYLIEFVKDKFDKQFEEVILEDENSEIYHSLSDNNINYIGNANVKLYLNRIEMVFANKVITLNFDELQTISSQFEEKLEIYYNKEAYRVIGSRNGVSALKWELAVNAIWKRLGHNSKLSSYISQPFD